MDLKDRSLRRLNSKSLRRDGFKVFSSKPIALNNAEQQKALSNDEPTKSLSPFFCCVVVSLSLCSWFLFVVTFRMKNLIFVSDSPLKKIFL